MTSQQTLEGKIAKMEAALDNPNVAGEAKEALKLSLQNAKEQLKELKTPKKPPAKKEAPKKPLKKDFYAQMDKHYKGLTLAELENMEQSDYDTKHDEMKAKAETLLPKELASEYLETYIYRHLPKGKTKADSPPKSQETPQPQAPPKPQTESKVDPPNTSKPSKTDATKPLYSWRKAQATDSLAPVVIHCQHYHLPVKKDTLVRLKGSGRESIEVLAKKGEHLIFDHKGYLVYIMNGSSFKQKCMEGKTLEEHQKSSHKTEEVEALKKQLEKANTQSAQLQTQLQKAEKEIKALKTTPAKPKETGAPPKNPTPSSAAPPNTPKPKASQAPPKTTQAQSKRSNCSLQEAETGRRLSKAIKFFLDEAEKWNSSKTTRKITKIMRTKGEKQDIILEVADYGGLLTGLNTLIGGQRKYYRLCMDSLKMTKTDRPKPGSYNIVVKRDQMQKIYTTRGEKQYKICLKTYRELLKCSFEGSCTTEQSKKWKELYQVCGDLVQKLEKQPQVLRNYHKEVKKRRKSGELYSDAMTRVAREIKQEFAE